MDRQQQHPRPAIYHAFSHRMRRGGRACRVLASSNYIGWINVRFAKKMKMKMEIYAPLMTIHELEGTSALYVDDEQ